MINIYKIYFWIIVAILYSTQYFVSSKETWEKIKASGYPLKMYEYKSEDNYFLGMERIPYSKYGNRTIGKPVILLSGMFATSIVYVSHEKSLGTDFQTVDNARMKTVELLKGFTESDWQHCFHEWQRCMGQCVVAEGNHFEGYLLSDAGFDVWLFNYRVTGMSKKIKDPKTGEIPKLSNINWDYCFHEFGVYDLPAAIDLVISVTGHSKVDVGGVSLGGTIPLITLAERPEYNKKIRNLLLMAPATRITSAYKGVQYYFLRKVIQKFLKTNFKTRYVSLNKDPDNIPAGQLCRIKMFGFICVYSMNIIQGFNHPLHIEPVIDVFTTYPQPTSIKSIKHYFQLVFSGRFTNYDYGAIGNMVHYNSINPPEYNITKITAPAIILYSKMDNLVPPTDIKWLLDNLPNVKDTLYIDNIPFSHQSFAMDKNSHLIVGPYIVKQLSKDT